MLGNPHTPPAFAGLLGRLAMIYLPVITSYSLLVLFAIPGITGFYSTALTIYVLAGMCVADRLHGPTHGEGRQPADPPQRFPGGRDSVTLIGDRYNFST